MVVVELSSGSVCADLLYYCSCFRFKLINSSLSSSLDLSIIHVGRRVLYLLELFNSGGNFSLELIGVDL